MKSSNDGGQLGMLWPGGSFTHRLPSSFFSL